MEEGIVVEDAPNQISVWVARFSRAIPLNRSPLAIGFKVGATVRVSIANESEITAIVASPTRGSITVEGRKVKILTRLIFPPSQFLSKTGLKLFSPFLGLISVSDPARVLFKEYHPLTVYEGTVEWCPSSRELRLVDGEASLMNLSPHYPVPTYLEILKASPWLELLETPEKARVCLEDLTRLASGMAATGESLNSSETYEDLLPLSTSVIIDSLEELLSQYEDGLMPVSDVPQMLRLLPAQLSEDTLAALILKCKIKDTELIDGNAFGARLVKNLPSDSRIERNVPSAHRSAPREDNLDNTIVLPSWDDKIAKYKRLGVNELASRLASMEGQLDDANDQRRLWEEKYKRERSKAEHLQQRLKVAENELQKTRDEDRGKLQEDLDDLDDEDTIICGNAGENGFPSTSSPINNQVPGLSLDLSSILGAPIHVEAAVKSGVMLPNGDSEWVPPEESEKRVTRDSAKKRTRRNAMEVKREEEEGEGEEPSSFSMPILDPEIYDQEVKEEAEDKDKKAAEEARAAAAAAAANGGSTATGTPVSSTVTKGRDSQEKEGSGGASPLVTEKKGLSMTARRNAPPRPAPPPIAGSSDLLGGLLEKQQVLLEKKVKSSAETEAKKGRKSRKSEGKKKGKSVKTSRREDDALKIFRCMLCSTPFERAKTRGVHGHKNHLIIIHKTKMENERTIFGCSCGFRRKSPETVLIHHAQCPGLIGLYNIDTDEEVVYLLEEY